jgi:hypothetical protein
VLRNGLTEKEDYGRLLDFCDINDYIRMKSDMGEEKARVSEARQVPFIRSNAGLGSVQVDEDASGERYEIRRQDDTLVV